MAPEIDLPDRSGSGVVGLAFTRGGALATGDLNGWVYLWNVASGTITGSYPDNNDQGIFGVAIIPDGKILAADTLNDPGFNKSSVVLWDTSGRNPIATLNVPDDSTFGNPPAFSPDGRTLAADSADGSIYLWNIVNGKPVPTQKPLPDLGGKDYGIAFSPNTGFLAAADVNGTAYLWNTKTGVVVRTFPDPDSQGVGSVAFSRNGKILATGDDNGNVYLWNVDAATETPIATLHGPEGGVEQSIAFSPRGGIVAATSDSTDLKNPNYVTCIWNLTGKRLATFHDPNGAFVTRVAFSPDGSMLAVADENANTYIWDMDAFSS